MYQTSKTCIQGNKLHNKLQNTSCKVYSIQAQTMYLYKQLKYKWSLFYIVLMDFSLRGCESSAGVWAWYSLNSAIN